MRSYSSRLWMCACWRKWSGHSNFRCSLRVESMLTEAGSAIRFSPAWVWCNLQIVSWEGECGWGSRKKILEIEELATVSFIRNLAGLVFSEKRITIARDEVIGFVSKP